MNKFFDKIKKVFYCKHPHAKNSVRYILIVVAFLLFLFFSNDFDLINVQKTAIVMAVGIDRVDKDFSVTTQIAVPIGGKQKEGTETVNVVTQGKTVAEALDKVNEKTGWYPKLVFCRLILLGESATSQNVFDGLDYFLRDEYITDDCSVAACEGKAEELLSTKTPIDGSGALAIEKVLSNHAKRVGTSMPNSLRLFAASYHGAAACGFLPLIKAQPLAKNNTQGNQQNNASSQTSAGGQSDSSGQQTEQEEQVFSGSETALFLHGKQVGTLDREESFLFSCIRNRLRLASYTLPYGDGEYTLTIRRAVPSIKLHADEKPLLDVKVDLTVGIADLSLAQKGDGAIDVGDLPDGLLQATEQRLSQGIVSLLDKCHAIGFDLFDAIDKLQKYEHSRYDDFKDNLLSNMSVSVQVKAKKVR